MATRKIGYKEHPDTDYVCSECQGVSVPDSTMSGFHFHHSPHCTLYRRFSSTMLSDRERFNEFGSFDRPYREHELTLIADSGKEVAPSTRDIKSRVVIYGTRGELGFYDPNWQYVGLRKKVQTVTL